MAGNPLASLPGLPQRPSLARSSASETRLTQPGIKAARSRKLNSAPTAAFRLMITASRDASQPLGGRGVRFKVMRSTLSIRRIDGGSAGGDDETQRRGVFGISREAP